jgi:DNA-binding CsgD family transcriptional regulator
VGEISQLLRRQGKLDDHFKVASGAFTEVLEARFHDWSLTSAEREVAIFAIKGFSIAKMAGLRDTKQGTIKAQCASVYRKADVAGRVQLLSIFLDDLLAEVIINASSAGKT